MQVVAPARPAFGVTLAEVGSAQELPLNLEVKRAPQILTPLPLHLEVTLHPIPKPRTRNSNARTEVASAQELPLNLEVALHRNAT